MSPENFFFEGDAGEDLFECVTVYNVTKIWTAVILAPIVLCFQFK